jgi:hypothetical protein
MTRLVAPALAGPADPDQAARIVAARDAALADPEGGALNRVLEVGPAAPRLAAE